MQFLSSPSQSDFFSFLTPQYAKCAILLCCVSLFPSRRIMYDPSLTEIRAFVSSFFSVAALAWVGALIVLQQLVFFLKGWINDSRFSITGQHVFITGGSKGLGLCLAKQACERGAKVTLVARSISDLHAARQAILATVAQAAVDLRACDVTDAVAVEKAVAASIVVNGPIDVLICNAGSAITGRFLDLSFDDFRRCMELNYMGTLHAVKPVIAGPQGMQSRRQGRIVLVSSALAMTGYIGYGAYSPTKHAVKGLAEVLRNELSPFGISVHNAYPAAMDTPGFETENLSKPPECLAIEKGEPVYPPETIAASVWNGLARGNMHITSDMGTNILMRASSGLSPRNNTVADMLLSPLLPIIATFVRNSWDSIVLDPRYSGGNEKQGSKRAAAGSGKKKSNKSKKSQ